MDSLSRHTTQVYSVHSYVKGKLIWRHSKVWFDYARLWDAFAATFKDV